MSYVNTYWIPLQCIGMYGADQRCGRKQNSGHEGARAEGGGLDTTIKFINRDLLEWPSEAGRIPNRLS